MNTTDKKFTVILSAYDGAKSSLKNLIATDDMAVLLATNGDFEALRAVGVFQGTSEQTFVIHTNSSNTVEEVKRLAWDFNQQCVLVSNNRNKVIRLYYSDSAPEQIGERFSLVATHAKCENYTILNGEKWGVQ